MKKRKRRRNVTAAAFIHRGGGGRVRRRGGGCAARGETAAAPSSISYQAHNHKWLPFVVTTRGVIFDNRLYPVIARACVVW